MLAYTEGIILRERMMMLAPKKLRATIVEKNYAKLFIKF